MIIKNSPNSESLESNEKIRNQQKIYEAAKKMKEV